MFELQIVYKFTVVEHIDNGGESILGFKTLRNKYFLISLFAEYFSAK